ncbi:hypothetical protein V565_250210 [Rhizoctonia solani 123E]|uniref:Uncharacterized protein n=1 Tax=Rhizoctonia solani 123E TaxID=1423351 RepID=A0A074RLS9_9AGAM|nr:hypothetical protein V565_250210 [Rhizoctonia solani 123E]
MRYRPSTEFFDSVFSRFSTPLQLVFIICKSGTPLDMVYVMHHAVPAFRRACLDLRESLVNPPLLLIKIDISPLQSTTSCFRCSPVDQCSSDTTPTTPLTCPTSLLALMAGPG